MALNKENYKGGSALKKLNLKKNSIFSAQTLCKIWKYEMVILR